MANLAASDVSQRQRAFLHALYEQRYCAICAKLGWCRHREPMVDLAEHDIHMAERRRTGK